MHLILTQPLIFHVKYTMCNNIFFIFHGSTAPSMRRPPDLSRLYHHIQSHHSLEDSSGRDLYLYNTQHSQQTDIHAAGEIQARIPRNRRPQRSAQSYACFSSKLHVTCLQSLAIPPPYRVHTHSLSSLIKSSSDVAQLLLVWSKAGKASRQ